MKKIFNKKYLGILISLILIAVLFHQIDIKQTIKSFGSMNPLFILLIIPVYLSSFIFRAFRWKILLAEDRLKFNSLLSSIFIGFSLNCVLPARAGEIYRAYFFSKKENLEKTKVFTSVILERVFDGLVLFAILFTTVLLLYPGALFVKITLSAGLTFVGCFIFLLILVKFKKSGSKREKIKLFLLKLSSGKILSLKMRKKIEKFIKKSFSVLNSFIESLMILNSFFQLTKSTFYTCLIWLIEGTFIFLVIKSFGIDISYVGAFFVLTVTAFSSLIPAGPAAIGTYQWGYIIALGIFGVKPELALAISITNHFLSILMVLSAGLFYICREHINFSELKQDDLSEIKTSNI